MKRTTIIIVISAIVALLVFAGIRQVRKSQAELAKSITQIHAEEGIPVEVAVVTATTFTQTANYLGTVEGILQNGVSASIVEEIVEIPVNVGDHVQKGQILCRLDSKASMANYQQLKLAYEDAKLDAERMERLYTAGAISKQAMEKANLNRDITRENLATSSQAVSLVAPFNGIVTDIRFKPGESTKMGEPIVEIADLNRVKIKFAVNYDDWRQMTRDTRVILQVNGDGSQAITAKVTDIAIAANSETRLFNIWVGTDNTDGSLQPGLLIDVRVFVTERDGVVVVPRDAVVNRNDVNGIFTVDDEGRAAFSAFTAGESNSDVIEVTEGLQPGQRVVVYGQNNLEDGKLVKIIAS